MDNTKNIPTVLSLCTGYGGIELGIKRVFGDIAILAHVEIEAFAVANLVNKMEKGQMDSAPIWTDIKTFNAETFRGYVDILTGGYPCQPFSVAGKRKGSEDERHLWPYFKTIITTVQPRYVFFENVEGHLSCGVVQVLSALEKMGYRCEVGLFSAEEIGAPHRRKRLFILGYAKHNGLFTSKIGKIFDTSIRDNEKRANTTGKFEGTSESKKLANTGSKRLERLRKCNRQKGRKASNGHVRCYCEVWPARPNEQQHYWEEPRTFIPPMGQSTHGASDRVDELRLLGNGVVPQTAEKAFVVLFNRIYSRD